MRSMVGTLLCLIPVASLFAQPTARRSDEYCPPLKKFRALKLADFNPKPGPQPKPVIK